MACGSRGVTEILHLGSHPFADTFIPKDKLSEPDAAYPLRCDLCRQCGHVQNACVTEPDDRYYALHNYSYTSSNSAFAKQHWTTYAATVPAVAGLGAGAFIVEVGSNDGFLCSRFRVRGFRVLGVDASPYMAKLAARRRVSTEVGLFGKKVARVVRRRSGAADLVCANNVFNHADDPRDFVAGVATLLRPGGWFVFEQPYWLTSIQAEKIDQVYHEHVSYFTVRSLQALITPLGFTIEHAAEVDYHGGSLRVYARRTARRAAQASLVPRDVKAMIRRETAAGLFDVRTYKALMARVLQRRDAFLEQLYRLKRNGHRIIAVGAPAKGNTFLNFYRLDSSVIDYVTDASPHKQGKFTPLTRIPIVSDAVFRKYKAPRALVLSWNIVASLRPKLKRINPRIQFISPEEPAT